MIRAILLLAALPMAAHAESWRAASYGEDYPGVVVLIDADSVARADGKATFRAQSLFEKPLTSNITRAIEKMVASEGAEAPSQPWPSGIAPKAAAVSSTWS